MKGKVSFILVELSLRKLESFLLGGVILNMIVVSLFGILCLEVMENLFFIVLVFFKLVVFFLKVLISYLIII